jgi:hypothetical protein
VGLKPDLWFSVRKYCIRRVYDNEGPTGIYDCNRRIQKDGSKLFNQYPKAGHTGRTYTTLVGNVQMHTIINLGNIKQREQGGQGNVQEIQN